MRHDFDITILTEYHDTSNMVVAMPNQTVPQHHEIKTGGPGGAASPLAWLRRPSPACYFPYGGKRHASKQRDIGYQGNE